PRGVHYITQNTVGQLDTHRQGGTLWYFLQMKGDSICVASIFSTLFRDLRKAVLQPSSPQACLVLLQQEICSPAALLH
ncbi:hypothetical protein KUCAC02_014197, partial [Chaenocephalus aceratus]